MSAATIVEGPHDVIAGCGCPACSRVSPALRGYAPVRLDRGRDGIEGMEGTSYWAAIVTAEHGSILASRNSGRAGAGLAAWDAWTAARVAASQAPVMVPCPDCAVDVMPGGRATCGPCDRRAAVRDAVHDVALIRDGMLYALDRHRWIEHVDGYADRYRDAVQDVLMVALPAHAYWAGLDWRRAGLWGDDARRMAARALCWDLTSIIAMGGPDPREEPSPSTFWEDAQGISREYGAADGSDVRDAMRACWNAILAVALEQAEHHGYCTEFESVAERLYMGMRTPGLTEPESRERTYSVDVPVTVTVMASVYVTARDEDDAIAYARSEGVHWYSVRERLSELAQERYVDCDADWHSAEAEVLD